MSWWGSACVVRRSKGQVKVLLPAAALLVAPVVVVVGALGVWYKGQRWGGALVLWRVMVRDALACHAHCVASLPLPLLPALLAGVWAVPGTANAGQACVQ